MNDQFFIDPIFMTGMQVVAYGAYAAALALMLVRDRRSHFFSAIFLATSDPRFSAVVGEVNVSIMLLYTWAVVAATCCIQRRDQWCVPLNRFVLYNRLGLVYASLAYVLATSLASDPATSVKSFILIFAPYFALLPLGASLAANDRANDDSKLYWLRGLQVGYGIYIVFVQFFAPGEVTGALGDISVSATIVAIMCCYGILVTTVLLESERRRSTKVIDLLALGLFAISAFQTLARGPLIAIVLAAPLHVFMLHRGNLSRNLPKAAVSFLALAALLVLLVSNVDYIFERRNIEADSNVLEAMTDQFLASRYKYILEVVDFDSIPLSQLTIGQGIGSSEGIARSLGVYRIESFWLEAAYDIGIVGAALLVVALARNAYYLLRARTANTRHFGVLYGGLFLFTLLLSPSSFGWFLQGNTGFVYVSILMLACRTPPLRRREAHSADTPPSTSAELARALTQ